MGMSSCCLHVRPARASRPGRLIDVWRESLNVRPRCEAKRPSRPAKCRCGDFMPDTTATQAESRSGLEPKARGQGCGPAFGAVEFGRVLCDRERPRRRPRGGVVTQRTANPCTPVRFRARPPHNKPAGEAGFFVVAEGALGALPKPPPI